ncbi:MAG TPA: ATP-binding protein [Chloroflexota bacterium]|nr:ATP-binding protein [Chloroflexota bacterium]
MAESPRARYVAGVALGVALLYTTFVLVNTLLVGPLARVPLPWLTDWLYLQDALDILAAALFIAAGAVVLNRLLARDEALRRERLEGEARVEAQRRFLADTSHELRNPLTVLRANLTMLQREDADPQLRQEAAHDAEEEAARLARLVDDLLLLARGEAGELIERRPVRLDALVAQVAEEAQEAETGHAIVVESLPEVTVRGDAERLRQVLRNVVGNALRHTPPGTTITVGLTRRRDPSAGSRSTGSGQAGESAAEIVVTDTGAGIAPEHLTRVFERFYRVDDRRGVGTGLGLPIVKHLVEAHGGSVQLDSAPGRGTRVAIRLPV